MVNFLGTYSGELCGFGGFLTAVAAFLYARARVAEFERATRDLDWQQVSEMSLDVTKLKKAAQKWQNNANAMEKVSSKEMFEMALAEKLKRESAGSNVRMMDR
jgi:poly(3-hydroxyalkanoate) synthetase